MAPAPAPPVAPAAAPAVGVDDEGARDHQNAVVPKSKDGDLPVPCSEPTGGRPEVTPEPVEDKGGDTTECSSSFGDTCSGFGDEADGGEPEVSSQALVPTDDDHASMLPRRKKVTAEWRNAIRPTMWRCQWLELRMKDLLSQVSRYDRELALIQKEKERQQAVRKTNDSVPDATPTDKGNRNSSMDRRKRKKDEDIADTSLYIKKHPILSHYNDKQSKGVETDGVLLEDDCSSAGRHDTVALLDAEEYDVIFEQVSLKDILSTIERVQSQVCFLKDRLNKAHLEQDNLAFSEGMENTHVRVPRKRQSTQKFCDTSSMNYQNAKPQKYRNAKPQKKKNLNILLKDDDGPALAVKPGFPDRGTDYQIENAKGNSGEKSGEWNLPQDRAITMDLLLGVDNSLPNGHMGDLCKQNADDILIDNRTANEGCPQFTKIEHLPSETDTKGENVSAPVEVKETSAPVKVDGISSVLKVDSTSATVVHPEPLLEKSPMLKPVKKREWKPRERKNVWGSESSSMNHSKGASATSDAELKSNGAPPAKEKTENTPTSPVDPEIMTPLAAWKKRKAGNKLAVAEEHKAGNLASKKQKTGVLGGNKSAADEEHKEGNLASKNQKTGKASSATKKRKSENSPAAAKKQETENSSPAAKKQKMESTPPPSKLMVEKAVLVAVNSRRSQRVRKPKVY